MNYLGVQFCLRFVPIYHSELCVIKSCPFSNTATANSCYIYWPIIVVFLWVTFDPTIEWIWMFGIPLKLRCPIWGWPPPLYLRVLFSLYVMFVVFLDENCTFLKKCLGMIKQSFWVLCIHPLCTAHCLKKPWILCTKRGGGGSPSDMMACLWYDWNIVYGFLNTCFGW